jgi:predicted RNA-binding Zn-ribbon protein involved in translation (DUF1610 family)
MGVWVGISRDKRMKCPYCGTETILRAVHKLQRKKVAFCTRCGWFNDPAFEVREKARVAHKQALKEANDRWDNGRCARRIEK